MRRKFAAFVFLIIFVADANQVLWISEPQYHPVFLLMNVIKNKSEKNILQDKGFYAPAVHCLYYSCFQLVFYILIAKLGKEKSNLVSKVSQSKWGGHKVYLDELYSDLIEKNRRDHSRFQNLYNQLKKYRIEADYEDLDIDISKYRKSHELMTDIFALLKKYY